MKQARNFLMILLLCLGLIPRLSAAQEIVFDTEVIMKARVVSIIATVERPVPGTDTPTIFQTLDAEVLSGPEQGKTIRIENDYLSLTVGQAFYAKHVTNALEEKDYYVPIEPDRIPALATLVLLFVGAVALFGGKQGLRGLLALCLSLFAVFFLLLPGILKGYSATLVAVGVSSIIIILGSYITHGVNRTTSVAVLGMVGTVCFTGILATYGVSWARLTGFESEEAVYLHFNTQGAIDFVGILLGGMLIGFLGVLYDAAIGQAVAIEELHRVAPHLSRRVILARALRIGREHIGALVNSLAIAYVGASLPLLLLFYASSSELLMTINREHFATEIVRTMIGSIGLVLAVPLTSLIGVWLLVRPGAPVESTKEDEHPHHHHH